MSEFSTWLQMELTARAWQQKDLVERTGIAQSHVSRVLAGKKGIGIDFLQGVAQAFEMPVAEVYQRAGLVQQVDDEPMLARVPDWNKRLLSLPEARRNQTMRAMEAVLRLAEPTRQRTLKQAPKAGQDELGL